MATAIRHVSSLDYYLPRAHDDSWLEPSKNERRSIPLLQTPA